MAQETIMLEPKRRPAIVPWLLLVLVLGGVGWLYWSVHRPLAEELEKKEQAIGSLTEKLAEAQKQAEGAQAARAELDKAQKQLEQLQADLARSATQKSADDQLLQQLKSQLNGAEVQDTAGQITVTLVDRILFKSGEAALTPEGEAVLTKFGGLLGSADKLIEVSGHADNQPVESAKKALYPTNWELSTARATNVVRFLQEKVGIKPRRLKAAGYGSARPVASNATANGRAKNRRIEILLLPDKLKVVKGEFPDAPAAAPIAQAAPARPAASKPVAQATRAKRRKR